MSTGEAPATDFDLWIREEFAAGAPAGFTMLIVLLRILPRTVKPAAASFAHVLGDEIEWGGMTTLLNGSGKRWDAAAFFPRRAPGGGPLDDATARLWRIEIEGRITEDRLVINEGQFFDAFGRRMRVDEVPA